MYFCMSKLRKQLGFTLAEVLIVVAIMAILFGLAMPNVISAQKSIRQKELDTKAETIYTAVQNKLTELYVSGKKDVYEPVASNTSLNIKQLSYSDIVGNNDSSLNEYNKLYYIVSDDLTKELLSDSLDENLLNGHFVIEILPYSRKTDITSANELTAATVYSVFYSEDEYDVTSYIDDLNKYRDDETRKSEAKLGYYGGSYISGASVSGELSITNTITSNELINSAIITTRVPNGTNVSNLKYTFNLSDNYGKSLTFYFEPQNTDNRLYTDSNKQIATNVETSFDDTTRTYTIKITLDDLSNSSTLFKKIFGSYLNAGASLKLESTVVNTLDTSSTATSDPCYGNSIYAYPYESSNSAGYQAVTQIDTVSLSNARHLQNLDGDNTSSFVTKAKLINDIDCSELSTTYYNGTTVITNLMSLTTDYKPTSKVVANFKPIENTYITSLSGKKNETSETDLLANNYTISNLSISSSSYGGLFGVIPKGNAKNNNPNNLEISNITLVGASVYSDNDSGSFIGKIDNYNNVTLTNCFNYLRSGVDIPYKSNSDYKLYTYAWIEGKNNAGGLVGYNNCTKEKDAITGLKIINSFSSTVLKSKSGDYTSGGLVGRNNKGKLTIDSSYSSSYLFGRYVGGLVGNTGDSSVVTITNSYASGYLILTSNDNNYGAGLVYGKLNTSNNNYTIMSYYHLDSNNDFVSLIKDKDDYYRISSYKSKIENTYYLNDNFGIKDKECNWGTKIENNNLNKFTGNLQYNSSQSTHPYKLMGQYYVSYDYPTFTNMEHYGDWYSDVVSVDPVIGTAAKTDLKNYSYLSSNIFDEWVQTSKGEASSGPNISITYTYYLYEYGSYGILKGALDAFNSSGGSEEYLTTRLIDQNNEDIKHYTYVTVSYGNIETNKNYDVLPIYITVKKYDTSIINNLKIHITVKDTVTGFGVVYYFDYDNVSVKPENFTVTLDSNGGTFTDSSTTKSVEVNSNSTVSSIGNIPTKEGYVFSGWYKSEECYYQDKVTDDYLTSLNQDVTIYAGYEKIHYIKLANKVEGGSDYFYNESVSISNVTTNIGYTLDSTDEYTFDGWYYYYDQYNKVKVFNADGSLNNSGYVENLFNNGYLNINDNTDGIILYAGWYKDNNYGLYKQVNTLTQDKVYLITNSTSGTIYTLTNIDPTNGSNLYLQSNNSLTSYTSGTMTLIKNTNASLNWSYTIRTDKDSKNTYNLVTVDEKGDYQSLQIDSSFNLKTSASAVDYNWSYVNNKLIYSDGDKNTRYLTFVSSVGTISNVFDGVQNENDASNIYLFEKLDSDKQFTFYKPIN